MNTTQKLNDALARMENAYNEAARHQHNLVKLHMAGMQEAATEESSWYNGAIARLRVIEREVVALQAQAVEEEREAALTEEQKQARAERMAQRAAQREGRLNNGRLA